MPPTESGVEKDLEKAKIYFKKGCDLGSDQCRSTLENIK
nr:SEL1-like repeat protein [uncultured Campylobacter sp.]